MSSLLAGDLVYREGIDFVNSIPEEQIFDVVQKYTSSKRRAADLVSSLESGATLDDSDKSYLIRLLGAGGARAGIEISK